MEVILIADPHIFGKNPICRKDNLTQLQFEKIHEIIQASNKLKIPILCLGDLTDDPLISYSTVTSLVSILNESKYGMYFVVGNHDLIHHNIESFSSTALGVMSHALPMLKPMDSFEKDYNFKVDFCHWGNFIEERGGEVFVSHKPVVSQRMIDRFNLLQNISSEEYYTFNDFKPHEYRLMLCGHWHRRYIFEEKGKKVINPGSLTRRKANDDSRSTYPGYVVCDLVSGSHSLIKLKCAKEYSEVISEEHLQDVHSKKQISKEVVQFLSQIRKKKLKANSQLLNMIVEYINQNDDSVSEVLKDILDTVYGKNLIEREENEI